MGKIQLYYAGDFTRPLVLDLKTELAKGAREHKIVDLFAEEAAQGCSLQPTRPSGYTAPPLPLMLPFLIALYARSRG